MSKKIDLDDAYNIQTPADNVKLYAKWAGSYDVDFAKSTDYILPQQVAQVGSYWFIYLKRRHRK